MGVDFDKSIFKLLSRLKEVKIIVIVVIEIVFIVCYEDVGVVK